MTDEARDWWIEAKSLAKQNQKLQQQLNRITNLMIGNTRIWALDRLAMEMEVEAELIVEKHDFKKHPLTGSDVIDPDKVERVEAIERFNQLMVDALFLRRLEWDLGELREAVRGDTPRRTGRYGTDNWKGPRP